VQEVKMGTNLATLVTSIAAHTSICATSTQRLVRLTPATPKDEAENRLALKQFEAGCIPTWSSRQLLGKPPASADNARHNSP
jgi:hypothetical protein